VSQADVELVRGVLGPFEQGDITPIFRDDAIWAAVRVALTDAVTADFECDFVRDDVGRATFSRIDGLRTAWVDWLSPWESYDAVIEDVIDANEGRVLVLTRDRACPKGAEAEVYFAGVPVDGAGRQGCPDRVLLESRGGLRSRRSLAITGSVR
jgi:hypothetical protein